MKRHAFAMPIERLWLLLALLAIVVWACALVRAQDPTVAPKPSITDEVTQGALRVQQKDGGIVECPLKHTDVQASISGFIADVKVTQTFLNDSNDKIEAVYVFPLSHTGAVDEMTMTVGDHTVIGVIKRRAEAREIYEQAIAAGNTASLLEQERPNIFTQTVGNIQPHETVLIEIHYLDVLKYDMGTYEFRFPMVVGHRYMPGAPIATPPPTGVPAGALTVPFAINTTDVPDGSRLQPAILAPGMRNGADISLSVALDAGVPVQDLKVTDHKVTMVRPTQSTAQISIDPSDSIPNKDFVLRYGVTGTKPEMALLAHSEGLGEGYFMLMMQPKTDDALTAAPPREVVFVIDTSGSMNGGPDAKVRETMKAFFKMSKPDDTMQVITFSDTAFKVFPAPVTPTPDNIDKAINYPISGGGTEMLTGLNMAVADPPDPKRVRMIIMLTDGGVGNENEIVDFVGKHASDQQRFCVIGIGCSPNQFLITGTAAAGRGFSTAISLDTDPTDTVAQVVERIHRAQLANVTIDWKGLPVYDMYPRALPDLWAEQPIILYGRYEDGGTAQIDISGTAQGEKLDYAMTVTLPYGETDDNAVLDKVWARQKIEDLGAQCAYTETPEVAEEITQTALKYHLMSKYTSLVAVDASEANSTEPVAPPRRVMIAVPLPAGVNYEGIFGSTAAGQNVAQANAQYNAANYARLQELYAQGAISSQDLLQAAPTGGLYPDGTTYSYNATYPYGTTSPYGTTYPYGNQPGAAGYPSITSYANPMPPTVTGTTYVASATAAAGPPIPASPAHGPVMVGTSVLSPAGGSPSPTIGPFSKVPVSPTGSSYGSTFRNPSVTGNNQYMGRYDSGINGKSITELEMQQSGWYPIIHNNDAQRHAEAQKAVDAAKDLQTKGDLDGAARRYQQAYLLDSVARETTGNDVTTAAVNGLTTVTDNASAAREKASPALATRLQLVIRNQSVDDAVSAIAKAAGLKASVVPGCLDDVRALSGNDDATTVCYLDLRNATAAQGLDWLLTPMNLTWTFTAPDIITVASARRLSGDSPWVYPVGDLVVPTDSEMKNGKVEDVLNGAAEHFLTGIRIVTGVDDGTALNPGTATLLDPVQLLVYGSPEVHARVATLLAALKDPTVDMASVTWTQPLEGENKLDLVAQNRLNARDAEALSALQKETAPRWTARSDIRKTRATELEKAMVQATLDEWSWALLAGAERNELNLEALTHLQSAWKNPCISDVVTANNDAALRSAWTIAESADKLPKEADVKSLAQTALPLVSPAFSVAVTQVQANPSQQNFTDALYGVLLLHDAKDLALTGADAALAKQSDAETALTRPGQAGTLPAIACTLLAPSDDADKTLSQAAENHSLQGNDQVALGTLAARRRGGQLWHTYLVALPQITGTQPLDGNVIVASNRIAAARLTP